MDFDKLDSIIEPTGKLARLEPADRLSLFEICLKYCQCFEFKSETEDLGNSQQANSIASIGGFPPYIENWPEDKNGDMMNFVLELPLKNIHWETPKRLLLFLSKNFQSFHPKDRSWFHVAFSEDQDSADSKPKSSSAKINPLETKKCSIQSIVDIGKLDDIKKLEPGLAKGVPSEILTAVFNELKSVFSQVANKPDSYWNKARTARVMASFYNNGISYNPQRASDSHYSHLVEDATQWFVLFNLRENSILNLSDDQDILFCIRYEDFNSGEPFKGRPIVI